METALWICQILLAFVFGYSGIMKSYHSRDKLVSIGQTGVANLSYPLIRFIGITELLGVAGIILPWALQILPALTPATAMCFALIMVFAATIHYQRKEYKPVAFNILLLCINIFVAYMRFKQL